MRPIELCRVFGAISAEMRRVVYLSPVSWHAPRQRPHHFAEWAARVLGSEVLWVEPTPSRLPQLSDLYRARVLSNTISDGSQPDWLRLIHPKLLPVDPLFGLRLLNEPGFRAALRAMQAFANGSADTTLVIGKPCLLAVLAIGQLGLPSVYDAMDAFPAFYRGMSRRHMQRMEEILVRDARSVWVSSNGLRERWCVHRPDLQLVPNGVSACFEVSQHDREFPSNGPLGYIGTIAQWFDWQWLVRLARAIPDRAIELVGPIVGKPPRALPANVQLLGERPHLWCMQRMQTWSAGLIPFLQDELTECVDPVKYYEYRAAGLPVISTAFGSMRQRGATDGVLLVSDPGTMSDPSAALAQLTLTRSQRADFIRRNSWDARFGAVEWHQ